MTAATDEWRTIVALGAISCDIRYLLYRLNKEVLYVKLALSLWIVLQVTCMQRA